MPSFAFPGASARLIAEGAGLQPSMSPASPLWTGCAWLIAHLPLGGLAVRFNLVNALLAALSVVLLFRVVATWIQWLLENGEDPDARQYAASAGFLGGLTASAFLAFSKPFWIAASRSHLATFDLMVLLVVVRLFLKYVVEKGGERWLFAFVVLCAAGIVEYPTIAVFAPLFALGALVVLAHRDRLDWRMWLALLGCALAGFTLYPLAAVTFSATPGFELRGYRSVLQVMGQMPREQFGQLVRALPRVGWLVVLVMSAVPWGTALAVARTSLTRRERGWHFYVLHLVLAAVVVGVLADVKFAPHVVAGPGRLMIVPYVLCSIVYGYLAVCWMLVPLSWDLSPRWGRWRKGLSGLAWAFPLAATLVAFRNYAGVDPRPAGMAAIAARQLVDSLEGRRWLATDGVLDDSVLIEARDRGVDVRVLNLMNGDNEVYAKYVASRFDRASLRNLAGVGLTTMLEHWLRTDPEARQQLAMQVMPEVWLAAGIPSAPNKALFVGRTKPNASDVQPVLDAHRAFWRDELPRMDAVPVGGMGALHGYWRRHLARVANDLGIWSQDAGDDAAAFGAYSQARQMDGRNTSALLNQAAMVERGFQTDSAEAIRSAVRDLVKDSSKREHIWTLARTHGFVREPVALYRLGLTWALSGRPSLAISGLERALALLPEGQATPAHEALAWLYARDAQTAKSDAIYRGLLQDKAARANATLGLARNAATRGDFAEARRLLDEASRAGADRVAVATELVAVHLVAGQAQEARVVAEEVVSSRPASERGWELLLAAVVRLGNRDQLRALVDRIGREGKDLKFVDALARGHLHVMDRDLNRARVAFGAARELAPRGLAPLEMLLRLDVMQSSITEARSHTRDLLRLDSGHAFGNYILGTLHFKDGETALAEDAFRRSLERQRTAYALNDLAWLLRGRSERIEAELLVREALRVDPTFAAAWDTLGVILLETRRYPEATDALEKALALAPRQLMPIFHLAQVCAATGNHARLGELVQVLVENRVRLPFAAQEDLAGMERNVKLRGTSTGK
jgi:tetratricopeptide (TPR) repeat protein